MRWLLYFLLFLGLTYGWARYAHDSEGRDLKSKVELLRSSDTGDEEISRANTAYESHKNVRIFTGLLLAFLSAGLVGVVFVIDVLPTIAQKMTHAVYDSSETVEADAMRDARAKVAQGDYEGAIEAFKLAAAGEPLNRLPWVEISRIYRENLTDPGSAILTLRTALEGQEWEINDAAYLMFRVAELYDEDCKDRASATVILHQVMEQFPNTRHSANARHRLHEWGVI